MIIKRTVVLKSEKLPKKIFRVFVELEGMYREMLIQLLPYAVENEVTSYIMLKAKNYDFLRSLYPQLPSHYAYTVCQDAVERVKGFLRKKRRGLTKKDYPEVKSISIWLDEKLFRLGYAFIRIATHRGWVEVPLETHKHYWRYRNSDWELAKYHARIKLDKRERRLIVYLVFKRDVEEYEPKNWISIDVNEDNVTALIDYTPIIFETGQKRITLGYYYRRKRVQEKWDKKLGPKNRVKKRIFEKFHERDRKRDIRSKLAKIIVVEAKKRRAGIVLEKLPKNAPKRMLEKIRDRQLRHRIYQSAFIGIQKAIEEKAREYDVPVIKVSPKNTSRICPIHNTPVKYDGRYGVCTVGGEVWHRDVLAVWNLYLRALQGDGGFALSSGGFSLDGSPVPLGSTATSEAVWIEKSRWLRWNSLPPPYKTKR
ncbi:RNA-guided endonuclease InsQ/TnpB family protein [Pyrococcus kukulkanii]|uniref:Transposase n=1 Tax=Pyrococcus kukulkanii TaxID=1609559 RepID=A0A127BDQ7_9EURY|nr:IS200/IS605 family accessory protein TnpB-related protein [Pyrococcus kukulkanii]AMM54796.1 transposase [Pyrococcus kukulkanii]